MKEDEIENERKSMEYEKEVTKRHLYTGFYFTIIVIFVMIYWTANRAIENQYRIKQLENTPTKEIIENE